ncbi:MAG: ATP-binding protein [Betaproteobacteria bacterium]|nr:ATP-binding protein [Betaproteobacteria bacterium]
MLRIAIDNLLGNAIKYSNSGDVVTMSAELQETNEIHIDISDTGIGITQEDITHIFDKYFRADNAQTVARSGHGLGLYLAKQIIELHQGSLSVESELGKGTTMSITLRAQHMTLEDGRH